MAKSYCLKVIDQQKFGCNFPPGSKKATVFWVVDPLLNFCSFAYPKGTSLCQDASFEPSTINIGSGVRRGRAQEKKGKGRDGWIMR